MVRVAVLDPDKCRPKHCDSICIRFCPKVRSKVEAIRFEGEKPVIVEALCSGCGICIKACPHNAVKGEKKKAHVINLLECRKCGICVAECKFDAIMVG